MLANVRVAESDSGEELKSRVRAVSCFSGCLGLDLGLEVAGIESVCYVEKDPDCLRLIKHHRPGIRVVTDIHDVDATLGLEAEVVAGGFPCQNLSYAGRGEGLSGDRSILWFEMLRVVVELRPRLVLVENVPGLLTRGLGVVLHGLAAAGYVGRWFTVGAVDVGAPHRRERVFVTARRVDQGRGEFLAGGHPSGLFDAELGWLSPQETLLDQVPLPRLGKQGRWTLDAVYEDDRRLALEDDADAMLLPTPNAYESTPTDEYVDEVREAGVQPDARLYLPGRKWHAQRTLSRIVPVLLPTPGSTDGTGAEDVTRQARQEGGATGGPSLRDLPKLLPTPTNSDWHGRSGPNADSPDSRLANVETLLPTPTTQDAENTAGPSQLERNSEPLNVVAAKLLPTPTASDADSGGSRNLEGSDAHSGVSLTDVVRTGGSTEPRLLPTPQAADGDGGRQEKGAMENAGKRPSGQKGTLPLGTAVSMRETISETPFSEEPAGQMVLLPTPRSTTNRSGRRAMVDVPQWSAPSLEQAIEIAAGILPREFESWDEVPGRSGAMLPTPRSSPSSSYPDEERDAPGESLASSVRLLPTPVANPENPGSGGELRAALEHGPGRRNETGIDSMGRPNTGRPSRKDLLPTPQAADGDRTSEQMPRHYADGVDNLTLLGAAKRSEVTWGVYEPAIRRWEHELGRFAPAPTDEKGRLAPGFVEWMLGYEDGWTDVAKISRTARLRMLGNSVQVLCGAIAGSALVALDEAAA